jgi:hypothetical protein
MEKKTMRPNTAFMFPRRSTTTLVVTTIALLTLGSAHLTFAQQSRPRTFASAGQAAQALYEAVKSNDESVVHAILGAGPELTSSGSDIDDKLDRKRFVQKYQEMHRLVREPDKTTILYIGAENWPFPIPLIAKHGKWYFDSDAGSQELLAREIGHNEITAIQVCQTFVRGSGPDTDSGADGDLIRQFSGALGNAENANAVNRESFHGYYFRVVGDKSAGVALVAYPAEYRVSGVMTFLLTSSGAVDEKDLGPQTATLAQQLQAEPTRDWVPVQ